jgi:hypothetical protein
VFEARRSSSMRTAGPSSVPAAASVDSAVYTPRDQETSAAVLVAAMRGQSSTPSPPRPGQTGQTSVVDMQMAARALDDMYAEETETNRKFIVDGSLVDASVALSRAVSTAPRFDEASADNPQKTVRPPPSVEVDVAIDVQFDSSESEAHVDDKTMPGGESKERREAIPRVRNVREDEETETMQLTPELRQRIEQMSKPQAPATSDAPPETRRLSKPPR